MVISPVRTIPHTHDTVPSRARAFRTESRNAYRMQNIGGGGVGEIIRCLPQNLLQNIAYAPRIHLPLCALRACVCVCWGALLPQCVTRAANESWWKSLPRSFLFSFCGTFLWFALFLVSHHRIMRIRNRARQGISNRIFLIYSLKYFPMQFWIQKLQLKIYFHKFFVSCCQFSVDKWFRYVDIYKYIFWKKPNHKASLNLSYHMHINNKSLNIFYILSLFSSSCTGAIKNYICTCAHANIHIEKFMHFQLRCILFVLVGVVSYIV